MNNEKLNIKALNNMKMEKINPKFYSIELEKQSRIINASFEVFSKNGFKKATTKEIAEIAGISKSLLFHYFTNKEKLYKFTYDYAIDKTIGVLENFEVIKNEDYFDLIERTNEIKLKFYEEYPSLNDFILKAYVDDDEIATSLRNDAILVEFSNIQNQIVENIDITKFKEGIDFNMVFNLVKWTFTGYLKEKIDQGDFDFKKAIEDSKEILDLLKKNFYRE